MSTFKESEEKEIPGWGRSIEQGEHVDAGCGQYCKKFTAVIYELA